MRFSEEEYQAFLERKKKKNLKESKWLVDTDKQPAADTPPAPVNGKARLQALGRKKAGVMNATEEKYARYLREQELAGEVLWWRFESIKLILADRTTLTVDFNVMEKSGQLAMIDVKGCKAIIEEDAKVKMKVAAEQYPLVFRYAFPVAKMDGGGWQHEDVR